MHTNWGSYRGWKFCPEGSWAKSYSIKYEPSRGGKTDDNALTGIFLHCYDGQTKKATVGTEVALGWLYSESGKCGSDYLTSVRFLSEKSLGKGDDTAANDLDMKCSKGVAKKKPLYEFYSAPLNFD